MFKKSVLIASIVLFTASISCAAPRTVYKFNTDGNKYLYAQTDAQHTDYFWNVPGNTYFYTSVAADLEDTEYNRNLIIKAIKPAYINRATKIDWEGIVPHKKRGYCVPSNKPGAAFAVDFISAAGFIKSFVVGTSVHCSYLK